MEEDRIGNQGTQRTVGLEKRKKKVRGNAWCSVLVCVSNSDFLIRNI
jgi:hypothetical protein